MAITTPDAVPGEVIEAAWGDAVRADLQAHDTAIAGKVNRAGDTLTGDMFWVRSPSTGAGVYVAGSGPVGSITATVTSAHGSDINTCNLSVGKGGTAAGTGSHFVDFYANAASSSAPLLTRIGTITQASASAVAYNTTSDPRVKTPGQTRDVGDASDRARQLGAAAFRGSWIDPTTGEPEPGEWDFLSSHDIEDVAPYAVTGERDAVDADGKPIYQTVNYAALVPLLYAALAEALDRIAALEGAAGV